MRLELLAFLCTLALFLLFGILLLADHIRVEKRGEWPFAAALERLTGRYESPPGRTVTQKDGSVPGLEARGATEAAAPAQQPTVKPAAAEAQPKSPTRTEEPPASVATAPVAQPPAEPQEKIPPIASKALNDILKAASNADWPKVNETLYFLGSSSASAGSGTRRAHDWVRKGRIALDAMDYGAAIEALQAATRADPTDADAHNFLATALLRAGRLEEAQNHVARSLTLEPLNGAAWGNAAEILAERDNAVAAAAALRVAIYLSQDPKRTYRFLSNADRTVQSAKFRAVVAEVLPDLDRIPNLWRRPT